MKKLISLSCSLQASPLFSELSLLFLHMTIELISCNNWFGFCQFPWGILALLYKIICTSWKNTTDPTYMYIDSVDHAVLNWLVHFHINLFAAEHFNIFNPLYAQFLVPAITYNLWALRYLRPTLPVVQNPWTMWKIEFLYNWPGRHLYGVISFYYRESSKVLWIKITPYRDAWARIKW